MSIHLPQPSVFIAMSTKRKWDAPMDEGCYQKKRKPNVHRSKCSKCSMGLRKHKLVIDNVVALDASAEFKQSIYTQLAKYCCFHNVLEDCALVDGDTSLKLKMPGPLTMFPVRCFSCNKIVSGNERMFTLLQKDFPACAQKNKLILDILGFKRDCCRRTIITDVSLVDMMLDYHNANQVKPDNDTSHEFITVMDRTNVQNTVTWRAI